MGTLKNGDVKITAQFSNTQKSGAGFFAAKGKKHLLIVTASHVVEVKTDCGQTKRKGIGKTIRREKGQMIGTDRAYAVPDTSSSAWVRI